jgi:toxin ParE1/3/4
MKLVWSPTSKRHLVAIKEYLVDRNPKAAESVILAIQSSAKALKKTPFIGRPGRVEGTRKLVIQKTSFIVVYSVTERVEILAVIHSSRMWPDSFST